MLIVTAQANSIIRTSPRGRETSIRQENGSLDPLSATDASFGHVFAVDAT